MLPTKPVADEFRTLSDYSYIDTVKEIRMTGAKSDNDSDNDGENDFQKLSIEGFKGKKKRYCYGKHETPVRCKMQCSICEGKN